MNVIGVYNPLTHFDKKLKQGGACLIKDNRIFVAISEERITRTKHDSGYKNSINYCLEYSGLSCDDIDLLVTSSCCEYKAIIGNYLASRFKRIEVCDHHLSHAYSAYYCSKFDNAIIIIMDGGGNTLEDSNHNEWWKLRRDQVSVYMGINGKIRLIERLFTEPYETGFGEVFRYTTKYLGFGGSYNVGKVMALSSYAKECQLNFANMFFDGSKLYSPFLNNPEIPIKTFKNYLDSIGLCCKPRASDDAIVSAHKYLAFLIQWSYQLSLKHLVDKFVRELGIKNVCIAGGVGLNCIANSYILNECELDGFFVQPASSDVGQCLGNAIYGQKSLNNELCKIDFYGVYLGRQYDTSKDFLEKIIGDQDENIGLEPLDLKKIAILISKGEVVGWHQDRAEFGPRALGNRSILADPRNVYIKKQINTRIKEREDFMPFAASVLSEYCDEYFEGDVCEYMTLAPRVKADRIEKIPAVVHVDSSCRAQKLIRNNNIKFYDLVNEFYIITGIPMVLNTSLNGPGEPICETPKDTFDFFKTYPINYLAIDNYLLCKKNITGL